MEHQSFLQDLGTRIKDIRTEKGMSQYQLAFLCSFDKAGMSRIEAGKINMTLLTLVKICAMLDVHIEEIFKE